MKPQSNSPGSYDDSAEPVYWWALAYGHEEIARWLREVLEVKPNPIDINGCLIQASRCEDLESMERLLKIGERELGKDISKRLVPFADAVATACEAGKIRALNKLIAYIDEETLKKELNNGRLSSNAHWSLGALIAKACASGNLPTVLRIEALVEHECHPQSLYIKSDDGNPLAEACRSGSLEIFMHVLNRIPEILQRDALNDPEVIRSACEGSNPSILSKILKPFTIEEIDTLFSLEIEWNKHPLYFATDIKILSLVFQKTSEKWKKEIVGSCLYKECVARALLKNNSPCVSFLLERISESYRRAILQSVLPRLEENSSSQLDLIREKLIQYCPELPQKCTIVSEDNPFSLWQKQNQKGVE